MNKKSHVMLRLTATGETGRVRLKTEQRPHGTDV